MHAFNSFFYPKLIKSGYASLRRWTKKVIRIPAVKCYSVVATGRQILKGYSRELGFDQNTCGIRENVNGTRDWQINRFVTIIHVSREQAELFVVSTSCPTVITDLFIYLLYFQVDIFAMDLVLVPVHLGMHWCLAVRTHVTFSPPGIETALTVADPDLQMGGGGVDPPLAYKLPPPHLLAHLHVNLKLHPIESPPPNILK